jgi:hypothetical protein
VILEKQCDGQHAAHQFMQQREERSRGINKASNKNLEMVTILVVKQIMTNMDGLCDMTSLS